MRNEELLLYYVAFVVYDHVVDGKYTFYEKNGEVLGCGEVTGLHDTRKVFLGIFCGTENAKKAYAKWVEFAVGEVVVGGTTIGACLPPNYGLELRPVSPNQPIPPAEVLCEVSSWVDP